LALIVSGRNPGFGSLKNVCFINVTLVRTRNVYFRGERYLPGCRMCYCL